MVLALEEKESSLARAFSASAVQASRAVVEDGPFLKGRGWEGEIGQTYFW